MSTNLQQRLQKLAYDFWWTGDPWANDAWKSLDPQMWEASNHNPLLMLNELDVSQANATTQKKLEDLLDRYEQFQQKPRPQNLPSTIYFCMEFGIHESFPIYSGGLGILAGDHIRSAGDMGIPLQGIGILYKHGYFSQMIVAGRQVSAHPDYTKHILPIKPLVDEKGNRIEITIPMGHEEVIVQAWTLQIGHATLYLLDTNISGAPDHHKELTNNLYGMGHGLRIKQEILLGIGGIRLLEALHIDPEVYHLNEGHAAFLIYELWIKKLLKGVPPEQAWNEVRETCVFTTHTPVPAGHDKFYWNEVNSVLGPYRDSLGLLRGTFMNGGREDTSDLDSPLSMTILGLKGSRKANGVSSLHGEVSRDMFKHLDFQIEHITNGVHPTAWMAPEQADLFDQKLGSDWKDQFLHAEYWNQCSKIAHKDVWGLRNNLRKKLITEVRRRLGDSNVLDDKKLTIGFARRFATYKRAALIFRDPTRLLKILNQGVQLIFSGKAHPADEPGQEVLATILQYTRHPDFYGKVVFIPNYDAAIGRYLTQGCDVWLNNPRRPREASGTSGQKASLNGNLNLSILDGWWPEGFDGKNGWGIDVDHKEREWNSLEEQDETDANALYELLEQDIVNTFKNPKKWTEMMKHTWKTCIPAFNTHRMVQDYINNIYVKDESLIGQKASK